MKKIFIFLLLVFLFFNTGFSSTSVLSADYGNEIFQLTLGYYYMATDKAAEALTIFENLLNTKDYKVRTYALREIILLYEYFEQDVLVYKYIEKYFEVTEDDYYPYLYRGIMNLKNEKFDEARKDIEKAYQMNPDTKQMAYYLASVYYATDDYDRAIYFYNRFLLYYPPLPNVLFNIGKLYFITEEYEKAINFLEDYIEYSPLNPEAYFILGSAYEKIEKYDYSIEVYEKAVNIIPDNPLLVKKLIMHYFDNNDNDKFKELILYLNNFNLFTLDDLMSYSLLGVELGEYDFTQEILNSVLSVHPELFEAYVIQAFIFENKFMYGQALNNYSRALQIRPHALEIYYSIGNVYEILNENEKALETYQKALKIRPNNIRTLFLAGSISEKMKNYEAAEEYFLKVIKLNPEHTSALNYLGYMYVEQDIKFDTALDLIKTALELKPKNFYYLDSLAWAYYKLGDYKKAYDYIKKSIEYSDSDEAVIYDHYGDINIKLEKITEAIEAYKKSLQIKEDEKVRKKLDQIQIQEDLNK